MVDFILGTKTHIGGTTTAVRGGRATLQGIPHGLHLSGLEVPGLWRFTRSNAEEEDREGSRPEARKTQGCQAKDDKVRSPAKAPHKSRGDPPDGGDGDEPPPDDGGGDPSDSYAVAYAYTWRSPRRRRRRSKSRRGRPERPGHSDCYAEIRAPRLRQRPRQRRRLARSLHRQRPGRRGVKKEKDPDPEPSEPGSSRAETDAASIRTDSVQELLKSRPGGQQQRGRPGLGRVRIEPFSGGPSKHKDWIKRSRISSTMASWQF